MNVYEQDMISEESEDEGGGESREEMIYRRKYQMLLERCEVLQQDNERLVHRIQEVYKYTRQVRKERKFLIDRLDGYGDNWRQGINQYFYDDNAQYAKQTLKNKHHAQSGERRSKKPSSNSLKKPFKEKTELDVSRKPIKESSSNVSSNSAKNCSKNVPGYSFM